MKALLIPVLLFTTSGFAQQLPENLQAAVKETKAGFPSIELDRELSSYSKNYIKIFGHDIYTFDVLDYGERNVYINDINRQFSDPNIPHIFKVMPLPGVNVDGFFARPCEMGY